MFIASKANYWFLLLPLPITPPPETLILEKRLEFFFTKSYSNHPYQLPFQTIIVTTAIRTTVVLVDNRELKILKLS